MERNGLSRNLQHGMRHFVSLMSMVQQKVSHTKHLGWLIEPDKFGNKDLSGVSRIGG